MIDRGLLVAGVGTSLPQMAEDARRAEAAGMDAVYCVEAYRGGLSTVAAIAAATERIRVGPYVLNAYARTPFATGLAAIDLDDLSRGRLLIGIGSGNAYITENWLGVPHEKPLAKMRDSVEIIRRMVRTPFGGRVDYEGELHSMAWSPSVAPFRESIPVVMAAIFPKMRALAGRLADGIAIGAVTSASYVRDVIRPVVRKSVEDSGRDPDAFRFLMTSMCAVDADPERARSTLRRTISGIFAAHPHPYYEFMLREQGFGRQLDRCLAAVASGQIEAAAEAIDDEMVDQLAIGGSPESCLEQKNAYDGLIDEMIYTDVSGLTEAPDGEGLSALDIPPQPEPSVPRRS